MDSLDLSKSAIKDLQRLKTSDADAAAAILVTLEEMEADPDFVNKLTTYGDVEFGDDTISVKPWMKARRQNKGLWRFRVLDTPATSYRVVYGYHFRTRQIWVLAVARKEDLDYDNLNSALAKRIFRDWYDVTGGQHT